MIRVKQITPLYDPKEDRLRLIINLNYPDRYDLWITRKFLINILDNIQNFLEGKKLFPNKNLKNNSSENNNETLIIYPPLNKLPILLESINISHLENNNFLINLEDANKNKFNFQLSLEELKDLINLIIKNTQFEWGINFL